MKKFVDPFEDEVDPVSQQLIRKASEPKRSQRAKSRQDYLDIATSGKMKTLPQNRSNTIIQNYDDDGIYDEEEEPRIVRCFDLGSVQLG